MRGDLKGQKCKGSMKLCWNFQRGRGVLKKIPSVGKVGLFSGTTQYYIDKQYILIITTQQFFDNLCLQP